MERKEMEKVIEELSRKNFGIDTHLRDSWKLGQLQKFIHEVSQNLVGATRNVVVEPSTGETFVIVGVGILDNGATWAGNVDLEEDEDGDDVYEKLWHRWTSFKDFIGGAMVSVVEIEAMTFYCYTFRFKAPLILQAMKSEKLRMISDTAFTGSGKETYMWIAGEGYAP